MSHDQDTAGLRAKLGQTHAMLGKIAAQNEAISKGASERYEQVVKRLAELHSKAVTDRDAANEYLDLTKEKGALLRTLSGHAVPDEPMAKSHIGAYVKKDGTFVAAHDDKKPAARIKNVEHVRRLLSDHGGKLYVRWSAAAKYDMKPGAVSRDYQSSDTHAGLSAVPVTADMDDHEIAGKLKEYGFLRMKDASLKPFLYAGEEVGEDSDGYPSIRPTKHVGSVHEDFVRELDDGLAEKMELSKKIAIDQERLNNWTGDRIGREIAESSLAKNKEKLRTLSKS